MTRTGVARHSGGRKLSCEWRRDAVKGSGPCRSLVSNWPRERSVRKCRLRAQTREGLEPQVDVALALCLVQRADHLASGRTMMFASVVIFLALPFRAQAPICFHGICCGGRRSLQEPGTRLYLQAGKPSHRQLRQKKKKRDLHRSLGITSNQQFFGRAPTPAPREVLFTSGALWRRDCARWWRPRVEELTLSSNDPPLADGHGNVQRDSRFPRAIHLWAR